MLLQHDKKTHALPAALAELALIDATTCALAGGMSRSRWYTLVQNGQAPKPAVSQPQFVRWRVREVAQYLESLGADSAGERSEFNMNRSRGAQQAKLRNFASQATPAA